MKNDNLLPGVGRNKRAIFMFNCVSLPQWLDDYICLINKCKMGINKELEQERFIIDTKANVENVIVTEKTDNEQWKI